MCSPGCGLVLLRVADRHVFQWNCWQNSTQLMLVLSLKESLIPESTVNMPLNATLCVVKDPEQGLLMKHHTCNTTSATHYVWWRCSKSKIPRLYFNRYNFLIKTCLFCVNSATLTVNLLKVEWMWRQMGTPFVLPGTVPFKRQSQNNNKKSCIGAETLNRDSSLPCNSTAPATQKVQIEKKLGLTHTKRLRLCGTIRITLPRFHSFSYACEPGTVADELNEDLTLFHITTMHRQRK